MPFGGYFVVGSRLCYERFFPRVFRTPSILKHQNQARRAEKNFLGDYPPLSQGLDDRHPSPPLIWRSGSATGLCHVKSYCHSNNLSYTLGMISNCPIPPKTSFTYIFRVNDKPGTYFYHGHLGGIRAAGLYGVLIIDPAPGVSEQWSYDGEHTLLLSDWYHAIQHELSIGLLEEEFRWAGIRLQFLTTLVLLLIGL